MNLRVVIAAGIVSALVGAMLGIVASAMVEHSRVGQRTPNRRRNAIAGAAVAFVIGSGYAALKQEGDDYFDGGGEEEKQG